MSSFRRAACLVAVLLVTACGGFKPLHQKGSGADAIDLQSVRVDVIEDREGQQLRNRLLELLTPRGSVVDPAWRLNVTIDESLEEISVEESSFATRANLRITANYTLSRNDQTPFPASGETGLVASLSDSTRSIGSFNVLDAQFEYANVIAERDAREKALRVLANDIVRRVGVWLNNAAQASNG